MKLIKENVDHFIRSEDAFDSFDIGRNILIKKWMKECIRNDGYKINEDGTIHAFDDINISRWGIEELPDYIIFSVAERGFYCSHNSIKTLKGFPKIIKGDFSIQDNKDKKWKENEILKYITVYGTIYS
jgi:hypothetical protein